MQPEKIQVLNFVTCFNIGGTERQVITLARHLDRARFELHVGCIRRTGELLPEIDRFARAVEFYTSSLLSSQAIRQQVKLAAYIRKQRIQLVHTYGFHANVLAIPAAALAGSCRVIASIRDTGDHLSPTERRVQKAVCRLADCVLANSEAVKTKLLSEGYRASRLFVINNGIDLTPFAVGRNGLHLRQKLGAPADAPVIAVLSRLVPLKGIEYFLQAAGMVGHHFENARFLVIGDGAARRELEDCARRLGVMDRVAFTGVCVDVPQMLSEIDISVLPSLSEGLSNTLLESMAAGIPVIATRVGGNPEIVEDGATGLLVPPRDAGALAVAICRLLEDRALASRLGQTGRETVARRFSTESMVRQTEHLYWNVLGQR